MQKKYTMPTLKERLACWRVTNAVQKGKAEVEKQARVMEANLDQYRLDVIFSMIYKQVQSNKRIASLGVQRNLDLRDLIEANNALEIYCVHLQRLIAKKE